MNFLPMDVLSYCSLPSSALSWAVWILSSLHHRRPSSFLRLSDQNDSLTQHVLRLSHLVGEADGAQRDGGNCLRTGSQPTTLPLVP